MSKVTTTEKVINLYHELKSGNKVAKQLGLWPSQVYNILNRESVELLGVKVRPRPNGTTDEQIITEYSKLRNMDKVAKALGVANKTVLSVLRSHGIKRDGSERYLKRIEKFDDTTAQTIAERYKNGESATTLSREYRCAVSTIHRSLEKSGISIRRLARMSQEDKNIAREMYANKKSYKEIAKTLGFSEHPIISFIHKEHPELVRPKGSKGPKSNTWSGGRHFHKGYIEAWVAEDDPLACMRDKRGYVLEHRLVMARSLGRPLDSKETVHHINGIKDDNSLKNLQLRQTKHGKGVSFFCADCGSYNIKSRKLKQ